MIPHNFTADYYAIREAHNIQHDDRTVQKWELLDLPARIRQLLGNDETNYPLQSERTTAIDRARLQRMRKDDQGLYELQFLRLRDKVQPEIATSDGQLRTFHLEDGEIIAESASALYDPLTTTFVLQHSYFGVNAAFMLSFLDALFCTREEGNLISLNPYAQGRVNLSEVLRHRIRRLTGRIEYANERLDMCQDMRHFSPLKPAKVEFTISANLRRKDSALEQEEVASRLQELHGDPNVTKLDVVIDGLGQKIETIQLLADTMKDSFTVNTAYKTETIRHEHVYPALKEAYLHRVLTSGDDRFEARRERLNQQTGA